MKIRLHGLRHSHASQLGRVAPAKVISERLGHSTVAFTLDKYSHLLPGMQRDAVNEYGAALQAEMERRSTGS